MDISVVHRGAPNVGRVGRGEVINPEPVMVFDAVQEVPQVCCIPWLILPSANAMCPLPMIAVLSTNTSAVCVLTANLISDSFLGTKVRYI